jgi:hypothetical protein
VATSFSGRWSRQGGGLGRAEAGQQFYPHPAVYLSNISCMVVKRTVKR